MLFGLVFLAVFASVLVGGHLYLAKRLVIDPGLVEPWRTLAFAALAVLGVSLLAEHQQDISNRFARLGDDKFVGLELIRRPTGTTLIPEALAQLDCRLVTPHVAGDHTLFVGEVEYVEVNPGRPLLYHAAAYRRLGPSPEGADSKSAGSPWPTGRDRV